MAASPMKHRTDPTAWKDRPLTPLAGELLDILCGEWDSPEQIANDIVEHLAETSALPLSSAFPNKTGMHVEEV